MPMLGQCCTLQKQRPGEVSVNFQMDVAKAICEDISQLVTQIKGT